MTSRAPRPSRPDAAPANDAPDSVLTVAEFAKLVRLNAKSVYRLIEDGTALPGLRRLGRSIRFHRASVVAWLETGQELPRPKRAA